METERKRSESDLERRDMITKYVPRESCLRAR